MRALLPVLIAAALSPAGGCAAGGEAQLSAAAVGPAGRLDRALPAVAVGTLDGRKVELVAELGGRPALVSLWATWCEACFDEVAALRRLHESAPSRGAEVAAVSVGEPATTVADFTRRQHVEWPQYLDPDYRFVDALGEKRVPTTLVVSAAGRIVFIGGKLDGAALAALRWEVDRAPIARR